LHSASSVERQLELPAATRKKGKRPRNSTRGKKKIGMQLLSMISLVGCSINVGLNIKDIAIERDNLEGVKWPLFYGAKRSTEVPHSTAGRPTIDYHGKRGGVVWAMKTGSRRDNFKGRSIGEELAELPTLTPAWKPKRGENARSIQLEFPVYKGGNVS